MTQHDELQLELPDYATGRLDAGNRTRVDAHLSECGECRDLAETFQGLGAAIREGGDSLFEPHPQHAVLRRAARPGPAAVVPGLREHLDACESCALELEGWKRMEQRAAPPARRGWGLVALASAAGLVAGVGLSFLVMRAPVRTTQGAPSAAAGVVIGPQLMLPLMLRGSVNETVYEMSPGQVTVVTAWPAVVPEEAAQEERYRFEIGPQGGAPSWSQELTAAEVRRHLDATDLVTLLVPAEVMTPGLHEMRVAGAGGADAPLLYQAVVEVRAPVDQAP